MIYSLLELIVWGRRSRAWRRWIYHSRLEHERQRELRDVLWLLWYGLRNGLFKEEI